MAQLIATVPAFSIVSSWRSAYLPSGVIRYTAPTTGRVKKVFDVSAIPYGSTIQKASLRVSANSGYSGGAIRVNGSTVMVQDITDRILPNSVGNFTEYAMEAIYTANGNIGTPPPSISSTIHYSYAQFSLAEIVIEYTPGTGVVVDPDAYRSASLSNARAIMPRAMITYPSGAKQSIPWDQIIGFTVNEGVKNGVLLGAVSSSALEIRLANDAGQWMPGGSMRGTRTPLGARLSLEIGLFHNNSWMYQPAGTFEIDKFRGESQTPYVTLGGFDDMAIKMERAFTDGQTYPRTLSQILTHISERAQMPYVGGLSVNGDVIIPSKPEWGACTLRNALSWVCQACASYGMINRSGILEILPTWREDQHLSLRPSHFTSSVYDERKFTFNRVSIDVSDSQTVESSVDAAIGKSTANTIQIGRNPVIMASVAQQIADGIRDALAGASWQVSNFTWRGDPSVTIGCRADITTPRGQKIHTTIMSQAMKWENGFGMNGRCEIDIGRAFADLGYDEVAIGGLPVGSKIRVTETDGPAWFTLVDSEYSGGCLLLRDEKIADGQYAGEMPTSLYDSKYAGTYIDNAMNAYYAALPEATKKFIIPANVPVRANASTVASAETLVRYAFALSAVELGFDGSKNEGDQIDYLGTVNIGDDYWTREPLGGMTGYSYYIDASGGRASDLMTVSRGRRPAICVYKNTAVNAIDGGFGVVQTDESNVMFEPIADGTIKSLAEKNVWESGALGTEG